MTLRTRLSQLEARMKDATGRTVSICRHPFAGVGKYTAHTSGGTHEFDTEDQLFEFVLERNADLSPDCGILYAPHVLTEPQWQEATRS